MQESQQDVKSEPRDEQQLNVTSTPQHADAPKSERQKPETKQRVKSEPNDEDAAVFGGASTKRRNMKLLEDAQKE